jgi:phosphatidylserine/phosphatidylglycerophosphate/cardiolipin synthase-like enzyme
VHATNKIKYYFNKPVNTSVSKGVNAQYLNNCMGDTIVAYINRAKYTLDIAVYNYTSSFPLIATAVNSAHNRGVRVRWIYDFSSSNTGLSPLYLNASINRLSSPNPGSDYFIMHNKFMVIDALSTNPDDAIVWTGSSNWNTQQFNTDYNNSVVIQHQPLAKAYRDHFNMMWGDTGIAPNLTLSKFGENKTDLGNHNFIIDGKQVEVYFSPADGVNSKILNAINSANTDMYFGMSTFTMNSLATQLVTKYNTGVYVAGINDTANDGNSPDGILYSGLGSTRYKIHNLAGIYHNKFLIVDASNKCSDPLVLTGSHNWTNSADTKNDENTLIIHDDTAANLFYQSFYANFTQLGGSLTNIPDCDANSIDGVTTLTDDLSVFPNPSTGNVSIIYSVGNASEVNISTYNMAGKLIQSYNNTHVIAGEHNYELQITTPGLYLVKMKTNAGVINRLLTVTQ